MVDFPNSPCCPGAQIKLKIGSVFGAVSSLSLHPQRELGDFLVRNSFSFWLCWVFVATSGLFLGVASGGYSLDVLWGLLIAGASLVDEQRL